jgi:hypothetical protein
MKAKLIAVALVGLLSVVPAWGKKGEANFKSVEIKQFTRAEGVEVPPEIMDFIHLGLRGALQDSGVFEEILGEDEVVDPSDADRSVTLDGTVLEYGKGSALKSSLMTGWAGREKLRARIIVRRRSNNETLIDQEIMVKGAPPSQRSQGDAAPLLARKIAREIKNKLGR